MKRLFIPLRINVLSLFVLMIQISVALTHKIPNYNAFTVQLYCSGLRNAQLEPCGCQTPQVGGLDREALLIDSLNNQELPFLLLDAGGYTQEKMTEQAKLRAKHLFKGLKVFNFDAINVCRDDEQFQQLGPGGGPGGEPESPPTIKVYINGPGAVGGVICKTEMSTTAAPEPEEESALAPPGEGGNVKALHNSLTLEQYYHYDALGNVVAHTNSSGDLVNNTDFVMESFGNVLSGSEAGLHLTSKEYFDDIDLYYFNARWYDPVTGRFISKAPMPPDQEHQYAFCSNNPSNSVDPSGEEDSRTNWVTWKEKRIMAWYHVRIIITADIAAMGRAPVSGAAIGGPESCYYEANRARKDCGTIETRLRIANSILHCVWQCCLTRHFGQPYAQKLASAHEEGITYEFALDPDPAQRNIWYDHVADLHNNGIGQELGECDSDRSCFDLCVSNAYRLNHIHTEAQYLAKYGK